MPSNKVALTPKNITDQIILAINKECGGEVLTRLADLKEKEKISTGIPYLDSLLQGGLPKGGIVEIFGQKQSGKTALALSVAGQQDGVLYIDGERAITKERAEIYGGHGNYIIDRPSCLEQALEHAVIMIKAGIQLVVLDSLPSIPTRKQLEEKNMDKIVGMALTAGLLSRVLGGINDLCYEQNATLVVVNQVRANMNLSSPWAEPYHTFGGHMLAALAHVRLSTARKRWLKDPTLGVYGAETVYLVDKSKHSIPRNGGEIDLIFTHGYVEHSKLGDVRSELRQLQKEGKYLPVTVENEESVTVEEVLDVNEDLDKRMES